MTNPDEKYMHMALKLAEKGVGSVEPNPAVGCVIVKSGQVIGKGWHRKFGENHAEINALENCKASGADPAGATIYVTLEPCCHQGKTPPCTDAIIKAKPAKVVVANIDPSPHANGKSIKILQQAGIEVQAGTCEEQARLFNAPFFKLITTGRPWVILKWAQSIDGKTAYTNTSQRWISNELSRKDVQKLRRRVQAILVGINTVLADDPLLTIRPGIRRKPLRIVLDGKLRIPMESNLLSTCRKVPIIEVSSRKVVEEKPDITTRIKRKGAEILTVPARDGLCELGPLLDELGRRKVVRLLVEGGPTVLASFFRERLVDEVFIYIASKLLGAEGTADISGPLMELNEVVELEKLSMKQFGDDIRLGGLVKR
jgi:diaminohydroxyphosphoribosylaminopyrimidine deaminase/5-amino-6-(5-phosphoribosylamino)uracil reductase